MRTCLGRGAWTPHWSGWSPWSVDTQLLCSSGAGAVTTTRGSDPRMQSFIDSWQYVHVSLLLWFCSKDGKEKEIRHWRAWGTWRRRTAAWELLTDTVGSHEKPSGARQHLEILRFGFVNNQADPRDLRNGYRRNTEREREKKVKNQDCFIVATPPRCQD